MAPKMLSVALSCALAVPAAAFVAPVVPGQAPTPSLRNGMTASAPDDAPSWGFATIACGSLAVAGAVAASHRRRASAGFCGQTTEKQGGSAKTAARYTTQIILPQLQWIKTGVSQSDLQPTELRAKILAGVDVLVGKDGNGKLFCVGNLCPHIGTPLSEGADVIGDVIVCPLHGSSWKVSNGELIDWCVSPPIIGPLTGFIVDRKNLAIFDVRESGLFGGGEIEVLIDTNSKKAYEADYWKGILDAQGKDDGSYY